ncbi:MAG TPA: circularly permuted type 2 ATP-grasp protein [Gammaproteobacteria bacterium]|nr:circularly permuted type 2 ATP-grasp protein [Gammaproteobacteria bacterium]
MTFITPDDSGRAHRPWPLDFFPFVISPAEWQLLEKGLAQRARLLNEMLVDVYGDRRVLNEGRLPAGALFGTPQFLRPCSRIELRDNHHVHFVAFDVGRSPDGRWWVLSDRTEAPSGAGYALENRIVTSRSFPDLFDEHNVQRHAGFFRAFSDHFLSLAARDEPLAVFLSRGPHKHTYFEHSYLARYLGFPVVEGSDLAVRDDRLFLKTVEGLRPVDLVMRTVRSEMCDPLELRADSTYGVPGLLQAARAGNVVVGNSLGSGVVESAAFSSFLPVLCQFYLGEKLTLPSVATWWCGQAEPRDYVLDNLDKLVVRQISTTRSLLAQGQDGRVPGNGKGSDRDRLVEQLRFTGHDFIAQETVTLSTAPVWRGDGTLCPVPTVLRLFVAVTDDGYRVLPGGLARASIDAVPHTAWLAADDISKDVWVLADQPVDDYVTLADRLDPNHLRRSRANLPSRAADSLFWLGRYIERADAALRLLRSLVMRLGGEMASSRHLVTPERIISLLIAQRHLAPRRGRRAIDEGRDGVKRELWAVIFDPESRDGLATVLNHVRRNAEAVRERLSVDAYRALTELTELPRKRVRTLQPDIEEALSLLNRSIQHVAAFGGLVLENMTRNFGWRFLDMGRRLERVRTTTQSIRHLTVRGDPEEDGSLELLLELADITMTYLSRYHSRPHLPQLADLLLADESNPRSVVFQLKAVSDHLEHLARPQEGEVLGRDQQIAIRLISDLRLADAFALAETVGRFGARTHLHRLCRQLDQGITEMSDYVSHRYFSHTEARRLRTSDVLRDLES